MSSVKWRPFCPGRYVLLKWQMILIYTAVSLKILFMQAKMVAFCYQLNVLPKDWKFITNLAPQGVRFSPRQLYFTIRRPHIFATT